MLDRHFAKVVRLEFELTSGLIRDPTNGLLVSEMDRLDAETTHEGTRLSAETGIDEFLDGSCQVDRLVESGGADCRIDES